VTFKERGRKKHDGGWSALEKKSSKRFEEQPRKENGEKQPGEGKEATARSDGTRVIKGQKTDRKTLGETGPKESQKKKGTLGKRRELYGAKK